MCKKTNVFVVTFITRSRTKTVMHLRPDLPYLLLADDDPDDRDLFIDSFLRQHPGYKIEQRSSGRDVLSFLQGADALPTILLLDYQMPDMNGPEVLEQLAAHARYQQMIKIMWSTSQRKKDMEACKKLGALHYFVKPGNTSELLYIVQQVRTIFELAFLDREKGIERGQRPNFSA